MSDRAVMAHAAPQSCAPRRDEPREGLFRLALALGALAYLAAVSVQLVLNGGWPTPDFLIPPLLLLAVAARRGWSFLLDWLPLLALVLVYEGFRGVADNLNHRVHYGSLIRADEWFFGRGNSGPSVLQSLLHHTGNVAWYDWIVCAGYSAHYVLPVTLGFALWLKSRKLYWRFATSFLVLYIAGFICFYLYPAAPPWMAAEQSMIRPIDRILVDTLSTLPATQPFAMAYQDFSPNLVAAMPSLHAATPMLLALIAVRVWGKRATPLLAYPFLGGLGWVYLGEHYFIDILVGWVLGIAAFVLVWGVAFSRLVLGLQAAGRLLLPQGIQRTPALPAWPLAAVAIVAMAYVWVDPLVRPSAPQPVWVRATTAMAEAEPPVSSNYALVFAPTPCGGQPGESSSVDKLLAPISPDYAAYLVGPENGACFALTSQSLIPPPDEMDLEQMESDDFSIPTLFNLSRDGTGQLTAVWSLAPSEKLLSLAGLDPGVGYLVIITSGTDRADDLLEVTRTVGEALTSP
jgi:membrane-associated phospholipid phosphatase